VGCALVGTQLEEQGQTEEQEQTAEEGQTEEQAQTAEVAFVFPHFIHVEEQGFECSLCHTNYESSDDPGMPAKETCMLCHVEMDLVKPADRQVASLFDGNDFMAAHLVLLDSEKIFSHERHATSGLYCNDCHIDIEWNESVAELPPILMDDCRSCHGENGVSTDCATCHQDMRADIRPVSHTATWGRPSKQHCVGCHFPLEQREQNCKVCHEQLVSHNEAPVCRALREPTMDCRQCHGSPAPLLHPDPGLDCNTCHK
jgi:hypothetical protein